MYLIMALILGLLFYCGNILLPSSGFNIPIFYIEILAIILNVYYLLVRKKKLIVDKYSIIILYLLFIHIVTLFTAENFIRALEGIKTYLFVLLIYYSMRNLLEHLNYNKMFKFINMFELAFFFATFIKIMEIVISNHLYSASSFYLYKNYFSLPFGESNYIAQIFLFFSVVFLIEAFNSRRLFYAFLSSIAIISILILNSRSAILSLIIIMLIYFVTTLKRIKINFRTSVIFGIVLFLLFIATKNSVFFNLIIKRFNEEQGNELSRLVQYHDINEIILNSGIVRFIFGHGMGTETSILNGLLIHNLILKLMFSIGVLGTIIYFLYLFIYIYDFSLVSKSEIKVKKYLFAIIALGFSSLVEPVLYTTFIEYFIVVYIALLSVVKKKSS